MFFYAFAFNTGAAVRQTMVAGFFAFGWVIPGKTIQADHIIEGKMNETENKQENKEQKNNATPLILLGLLVICLVIFFLKSYGGTGTSSNTKSITLVCEDCKDAGMEINIWSDPQRSGVKGSVPSGTKATELDNETYDGIYYYKVTTNGITGWVSSSMVEYK